jgi:protein-glutamine gamma-glutamyltransferase
MIRINGRLIKKEVLENEIPNAEYEAILSQMISYNVLYDFESINQLKFELLFRANTVKAAKEMNEGGAQFTTYANSFCNKKYWMRLRNGGFLLREGIAPSVAILDIIKNGKLYAFECSTAIAMVLYIATLYSIGPRTFNMYFNKLYLYNWQFDDDLPVYQKDGMDFLIGDVLHFNNPDFDPKQPWWKAENVIFFGNDTFYGHGMGIRNAETIIDFLNNKRKRDPKVSAYLMSMISRPNYQRVSLLR